MKNEIKFTPFGKISINFIKNKNIGPQNEGPWAPRMQMVLLIPTELTQNKTDLNHHTFSKEWLIVSVKIPHHTIYPIW